MPCCFQLTLPQCGFTCIHHHCSFHNLGLSFERNPCTFPPTKFLLLRLDPVAGMLFPGSEGTLRHFLIILPNSPHHNHSVTRQNLTIICSFIVFLHFAILSECSFVYSTFRVKGTKGFFCFLACFLIFLKSPIYFQYEASLKKMKMCIVVLLCARCCIQCSEIIWLHGLDFQTIFNRVF